MANETLAQLILVYRRGRTNEELCTASQGEVSSSRWSQLATSDGGARPLGRIPETSTLRGVAYALGLPTFRVLVAAAASLGIQSQDQSPLILALAGLTTHVLDQDDIDLITRLVERLIAANCTLALVVEDTMSDALTDKPGRVFGSPTRRG